MEEEEVMVENFKRLCFYHLGRAGKRKKVSEGGGGRGEGGMGGMGEDKHKGVRRV